MISVEQAMELIGSYTPKFHVISLDVNNALGFVLAQDVLSSIDMPPFPQSAMDGYALGSGAKTANSKFKVIGEVAAGSADRYNLQEGESVRIFTGAPVPETASAVVQQEWVERNADSITLQKTVAERMHIRPQGEQMRTGDLAMKKGAVINAAAVGFLSMLGVTTVRVFARPKVAVLITGNELERPGTSLRHGKIFESNSFMLIAALQKEGIDATSFNIADDLNDTVEAIEKALSANDMIILSGGISVGDHDHVGTALNRLGVKEVFYKVKQKPGKPIFFGTKEGKAIFALPGNPAASLSCFYIYVLPIIRKMQEHPQKGMEKRVLPLAKDHVKKGDRAIFLKGSIQNGEVSILDAQSSAMLNSFAKANVLVYFNENSTGGKKGDQVQVYCIPS